MSSSKKIIILGQYGVGKTSLTRRFVDNAFSEDYLVTLGVQIKKKTLQNISGEDVALIIWDVEGTKSVKETRQSYILGTHAIVYVFDATRVETYDNIDAEIELLKNYNVPIKILANKADIANTDSVLKYLENSKVNIDFFTSALSGENVEKVFQQLANELTL